MDNNSASIAVEIVKSLPTIVASVAAIIASAVAIYGINSWRREFKGKRQIELAEDVLALFYEARDAITAIRYPLSYETEGRTRKPEDNETEQEKKARDRAYIVWERYSKRKRTFNKLHSMRYRFMAQIGKKESEPFEEIRKIVNEIFTAAGMLRELWAEYPLINDPEEKKEYRKQRKELEEIFWWQGSKDALSKRVDDAIADIEKTCKKTIMQNREILTMNKKQKICLWVGIIAFAFVGLISQIGNIYTVNTTSDTIVYISKLLIRWIVIAVVTIGLIYTFGDKKDKKSKDDQKQ